MANTFTILEIRLNNGIDPRDPSYGTFDIKVGLDGSEKWFSVMHEVFFDYIKYCNPNLYAYVDVHHKLTKTYDDVIDDLLDLGYKFDADIATYIESSITKHLYKILPGYDPDFHLIERF